MLLWGNRPPCMHEIVLIHSLKCSGFSPCKYFVMILMHTLLWFIAGEANAMLVKARAKAEAIQLLAAALAQQVSDSYLEQPLLCAATGGGEAVGRVAPGFLLDTPWHLQQQQGVRIFAGLGWAGDTGRDEPLVALDLSLYPQHGNAAASLSVAEQYVNAFSKIAKDSNTVLLPANTGDVTNMVAQVSVALCVLGSIQSPMASRSRAPGARHPPLRSQHGKERDLLE